MLAAKMREGGGNVQQRTCPGVTHEFFGMGTVVAGAKLAETFADVRLAVAFTQPVGGGSMDGAGSPSSPGTTAD